MSAGVVGRPDELVAIGRFVRASEEASVGILLEGPPGQGKTTLWRAAIESAGVSHRILQSRPTEAEAKLAYAGLSDLLVEIAPSALPDLPVPQRDGLEGALLLREPTLPPDPRLLGTAVLALLRVLAARMPVLVAVDDLHWLDPSSLATLAFAARRLNGDEPVGFLFARRPDVMADHTVPTPPGGFTRIDVGPLGFDATAQLVARSFAGRISRPDARRIWNASEGNPLYALELATVLEERREQPDPTQPLQVRIDLEGLIADRLRTLPAEARSALLAVALSSEPTRALVTRVVGDTADGGLASAIQAEIIEEERGRLRFAHPLVASAIASLADPEERRRTHRLLAQAVGDPEQRALHLALGGTAPDESVAAALDEAVARALARGAPASAAEYAEHALRFTDPSALAQVTDRTVAAGRLRLLAGDQARGIALLEDAVAQLPPGIQRARVLCFLAEGVSHDLGRASASLTQALEEAEDDPAVRARALGLRAALMGVLMMTDLHVAEAATREAMAAAETIGDPELIVQSIAYHAWIEAMRGNSPGPFVARANAFPDLLKRWPLFWLPERTELFWRERRGDHTARHRLEELRLRALELGEEEAVSVYAFHLADLEIAAGRWDDAARHAAELAAFAEWSPPAQPVSLSTLARLAACRGDRAEADDLAQRGVTLAQQLVSLLFELENRAALTLAALGDRDPAAAVAAGAPAWARVPASGLLNPSMLLFLPDYIEALIAEGRADDAAEPLEWLDARSREQGHPWGSLVAARCRALHSAAAGDLDAARAAFADAFELHGRLTLPFEEGRTLLAQGEVMRRARRRNEAREALTAALARFEDLGARRFAARAADELKRIAGRAASTLELTPAQQRVAELVAQGFSNKEVAAALVISENTVESHLRQVYAKLGLTTRVQLARHVLGG